MSGLIPHHPQHKAYGNLTGQFPFKSSRDNAYSCVLYGYDSNAILVEAVQNCHAQTLANAWTKLINYL